MSNTKKVAHNTLYQFVGRGLGTLFALVTVAIMTRYLGKEGFGQYTTIMTFLLFFGILSDLGLTLISLQMISQKDVDVKKIWGNILSIRLLSVIIFMALAPILAWFLPYDRIIKLGISVAAVSFVFSQLSSASMAIFQKNLATHFIAFAEVINKLALLLFVFLVATYDFGLLWMLHAITASNALQCFLHFYWGQRFIPFSLRFDASVWKKIFSKSWPLAVTISLNLLYLKTDTLILSFFKSSGEVGLYGAAYKVIDVLTLLPFIFSALLLPFMISAWEKKDMQKFHDILQKGFDALALIAVPMLFGVLLVAAPTMTLVAGKEFLESGKILSILIFAAFGIYFNVLFGHAIIAIDKQKSTIPAYGVTAALALTGYMFFIPRYSFYGAAAMTVFSEIFIALFVYAILFRYTAFVPKAHSFFKSVVAGLFMTAILLPVKNISVFVVIPIGILIYTLSIVLLGGIPKQLIPEILGLGAKKNS